MKENPQLGVLQWTGLYHTADGRLPANVMAQPTGEYRPPKQGEWYLSGSVIEAYRAPNDLSSNFHIARLVETEKVTVRKVARVLDNDGR